MTTTLYIDTDTGRVSRTVSGNTVPTLRFTLRDILTFKIGFVQAGTLVSSTVLAASATMKIGLKPYQGYSTVLALGSSYSLASELATMTVSLNTAELVAYFASLESTTLAANFILEVEVTAADTSTRQTFCQLPVTVWREVNSTDDTAPSVSALTLAGYPIWRYDITAVSTGTGCLDAVETVSLPVNTLYVIRVSGEIQMWLLETSTAATATGVQRPLDYNASTNTKVWTRKA